MTGPLPLATLAAVLAAVLALPGAFAPVLAANCGHAERAALPACMTVRVLQDNYGRRIEVDNDCGYEVVAAIDVFGLASETRTFGPGLEKLPLYHQRQVQRVRCCRKEMFPGQCGEVLPGW